MKRQQYLLDFFTKKTKTDTVASETGLGDTNPSQSQLENIQESSASIIETEVFSNSETENNLPECWFMQQFKKFKEKHDGLIISNNMLGCEYCAQYQYDLIKMKSVHVPKEWKNVQIKASGKNKEIQQASLRKKWKNIFNQKLNICVENFKQLKQDSMGKVIDTMNEKYLTSTCRIFNTIYSLTKRCKPFSDIEDEIGLQIKNGLDMGIALHSRNTAVKIVDYCKWY